MNFSKKLSTLINATVRYGLSMPKRKLRRPKADPESDLDTLRRQLAEVEAKEREVADLLKVAQTETQSAREEGRATEAAARQRLVAELEAHLDTRSTQAIALSKKLKALQAAVETQRMAAEQAAGDGSAPASDSAVEDGPPAPPHKADLSARKSRLSD